MSLTSFGFIFFFSGVVLISRALRNFSAEKWFLLVASCVFYATWNVPCLLLILFTSVSDYLIAQRMGRTNNAASRKRLLLTSLAFNLGALGFFKYSNFFLENVHGLMNALGWHVRLYRLDLVLPPGISYYTFATLSYVLDVYYERIPVCESARDYALFITFFPKLLSGPIVRGRELLSKFKTRTRASIEDIEQGLTYLMTGAIKKLVIADQVAPQVDVILAAPGQYDSLTLLEGLLGYAIQIYGDFAGYSDMAIGCGRILGFRFPENFQMPFSALSITEFWRRWHMSLSRWFRDYVFLPLEIATRNNPSPLLRISLNMMLMMLLVGLWHGPSWNFVVLGAIHGFALIVHRIWTTLNPLAELRTRAGVQFAWTICARILTLSVVLVGFVFFRYPTIGDAGHYLRTLVSFNHGTRLISPYIMAALVAVLLVHLFISKDRNWAEEIVQKPLPARILGYGCLLLVLVSFAATDGAAFIYFRF